MKLLMLQESLGAGHGAQLVSLQTCIREVLFGKAFQFGPDGAVTLQAGPAFQQATEFGKAAHHVSGPLPWPRGRYRRA